jgi:diguanylate cyclase (GGDEF)-like protein
MARISTGVRRLSAYVAALGLMLIVLTACAWAIAKYTIDHLLTTDAVATGYNWASYLAVNVVDIEQIAAGEKPSPASLAFFERAQEVGQVFRYQIFDPTGRLRLASDELARAGAAQSLAQHHLEAAQSIAAGRPLVEVHEGNRPGRPAFFAEAYVPVRVKGRTVAIVETYVDLTEKRTQFRNAVSFAGVSLSLLTAFAFGAPALAWYRRTLEKQRAEARIDFLADHDRMTGLANRDQLARGLGETLALMRPGEALAILSIDLDRFKSINDTLGHDAGDLLIKTTAERLGALTREAGIVGRLSGDEFAVLQPDVGDAANAEALAREICTALALPCLLDGKEAATTASVGIAMAPTDGHSAFQLMACADLALDRAKADGRNCFRFYLPEMDAQLQARLRLERMIRKAAAEDGFELFFQPLYTAVGNRLVGFEALLRMRSDDGSLVSPSVFIPLAEEMGLIGKIGAWVLRRACEIASTWPDHLTVAVNLSPAQFAGGSIAEMVSVILDDTGFDAHRLELEITESLLLRDTDAVLAELQKIKALGAAVVMDDFGTGYSSLSYLWRFPFDKIKIDRAFVAAFDAESDRVQTVVRTIVGLGRSLHMRVTAEGIETPRQAAFLRELACDQLQGFLFGRPMPSSDLAACILADGKRAFDPPGGDTRSDKPRTQAGDRSAIASAE